MPAVAAFITQQQELVGLDVPRQLVHNPKPANHHREGNRPEKRTNKPLHNMPEARKGGRLGMGLATPSCKTQGATETKKKTQYINKSLVGEILLWKSLWRMLVKVYGKPTHRWIYWWQRQKLGLGSGTSEPHMRAVNPCKWQKKWDDITSWSLA